MEQQVTKTDNSIKNAADLAAFVASINETRHRHMDEPKLDVSINASFGSVEVVLTRPYYIPGQDAIDFLNKALILGAKNIGVKRTGEVFAKFVDA